MKVILLLILGILITSGGFYLYESRVETPEPHEDLSDKEPSPPFLPLPSLNRSSQGPPNLPSGILSMTNLQQLDISNNKLTGALPAEIRFLQNLEILDISNNQMTGLPAEPGQLSKLRILNASSNKLTGIPHELGNLQNLEVLDLSDNDISEQDLEIIRAKLPKTTEIIL